MTNKLKRNQCVICKKKFKHEVDLSSHSDIHTPYWKGKKVVLSGGDQIRLLLKSWSGSWTKYLKEEKKRKIPYDYEKSIKLRDFEKENKIQFVICGDRVSEYKCMSTLRGNGN